MAATQCMTDQAKKDFADGVNLAASTYKIALLTSASSAGTGTTTWASINANEVSGTGYSAGGSTLTRNATTISSNHALLNFTSPVTWSNSTITARSACIYNSTSGNVVALYDFGSDKTSSAGDFTITIPAGAVAIN
jgi:hypothetical protein